MKKLTPIIIMVLSAVVFATSMVFFVIGFSNIGKVEKNNPDENPIVYTKEFRLDVNKVAGWMTVRGTIKNIDNESHHIKLYVKLRYIDNLQEKTQDFKIEEVTLRQGEVHVVLANIDIDSGRNYVGIESATAMIQSVPHKIIKNQQAVVFDASIIYTGILMVAGFVTFMSFALKKPKYVEHEVLSSFEIPNLSNLANVVVDQLENAAQPKEDVIIECAYCGTLNKLGNGKCSACGASLKKGKK